MNIKSIVAYEVLDSRGFPTVAAICETDNGGYGKSMVPSGASTGEKEAMELRDGDKSRYMGKGVLRAVNNVNSIIAPALIGKNASDQVGIDAIMIALDDTPNKAKLGANAILAVSLAVAKAAASEMKLPLYRYVREVLLQDKNPTYRLPVPMLNVINGGAHADNSIDFQEFMFMPLGAKSMAQAVRIASECFHKLQDLLKKRKLNTNKGDEGGFAPNLKTAEDALNLMVMAITEAGYTPSVYDVAIAMDCASSELYNDDKTKYVYKKAIANSVLNEVEATVSTTDLIDYYEKLINTYPIISIEDGLGERDWDGFAEMTRRLGGRIQIVGDDLYCTNPNLTKNGISKKASNSVLIKLNQIGTLSETIQTVQLAQDNEWTAVISHRSGETEDTTIADLAVALDTLQIKTGSMSRSERIAKYNRLIEIELEQSPNITFPGISALFNIK